MTTIRVPFCLNSRLNDIPMNTVTTSPVKWTTLETSQLLLVKGPDAAKFLQGQVTCDIRELSHVARMGAQCNPKGRILLTFRALQLDAETIALRIPISMRDHALQSLGKYIVFSKATLIDAQQEFDLIGVYGEEARTALANLFTELPKQPGDFCNSNDNLVICIDENRYECWLKIPQKDEVIRQLTNSVRQGTADEWSLLDIEKGIGQVLPETREIFTPQEINFQLINGVNFRKGCYTGQEIVARLHYRGKLKRHMYRFILATEQLPVPGEHISNLKTHQAAGMVVMAAWREKGEAEILASVLDEHLDDLALMQNQQKLKRLPLPYAIPTADEKDE